MTISLFMFIILGPTIQSFTPFMSYGDLVRDFDEKRTLAKSPKLSFSNIDSIPKQFDRYINDNFEFRTWLIAWNNYIKVKTFKISPNKSIGLGADDWMYFIPKNSNKNIVGKALFSDKELEQIKENIENKNEIAKRYGSKFYLVIAPNKSSIYPENLPYYLNISSNSQSNQLFSFLAQNSNVNCIFLKDAIFAQKSNQLLFYKTDSHWNHNGAFIGFQKIMKELRKDFKSFKLYTQKDYVITSEISPYGGDLAKMLALESAYTRINYNYKPTSKIPIINNQKDSFYTNWGQYKDLIFTKTCSDSSLPKLVMFHDSFTGYQWNFFGANFSKSVFVWSHDYSEEIIAREKPDVVIFSIVERSLSILKNK